jgi:DNA transformation protein
MKDSSFKDFILDPLQRLGRLECRAMFGGFGFYHGPIFFGILFKNRLYFKADSASLSFTAKEG